MLSWQVDENVQRVASPATAFIDDKCIRELGAKISLPDLFKAWQEWCRKTNRPEDMANEDMFSAQVRSATRSGAIPVTSKRKMVNGERTTWFLNLRLRGALDPDENDGDDRDEAPEAPLGPQWIVSGMPL